MYSDPHCKDLPPTFAVGQPEGIAEVVLKSSASSGWGHLRRPDYQNSFIVYAGKVVDWQYQSRMIHS